MPTLMLIERLKISQQAKGWTKLMSQYGPNNRNDNLNDEHIRKSASRIDIRPLAFTGWNRFSNLAIACANSHRMLHRSRPTPAVDAFRRLISPSNQQQYGCKR